MAADPLDPFLPYAIAQEYVKGEMWVQACEEFEGVRVRFPDYLPTYYHYGMALVNAGRVEEAVSVLQEGETLARAQRDGKTAAEIEALLDDLA